MYFWFYPQTVDQNHQNLQHRRRSFSMDDWFRFDKNDKQINSMCIIPSIERLSSFI